MPDDRPAALDPALSFLLSRQDMAGLMRSHDWASSPLGPPAAWPASLRALVGVMLNSSQAMFIAWGAGRTMLYNDAYGQIMGSKHPAGLGRPFEEVWAEILDDVGPIMDRGYRGEPTQMADLPLTMWRHGYPEETHFSFSYTPVRDEAGSVVGVFCACTEITETVFVERRQKLVLALGDRLREESDPAAAIAVAAGMLARHLGVDEIAYGEIDEAGELADAAVSWSGDAVRLHLSDLAPEIVARLRRGEPAVIGDLAGDPGSARPTRPAWLDRPGIAALLMVPLIKGSRPVALLAACGAAPRIWTPHDVKAMQEVAERAWATVERLRAEERLRDRTLQLETLINVAPLGVYLVDGNLRIRHVNPAAAPAFGDIPGLIGRDFTQVVHILWPMPYADEVVARFRHTLETGEPHLVPEHIERRRDRRVVEYYRWQIHRIPLPDGGFGVVCYFQDISAQVRAREAIADSEARLRHIIDSAVEYAIIGLDEHGVITSWNSGAERLLGYPEAEVAGRPGHIFFTPEDRAAGAPEQELHQAQQEGRAANERWHVRKDGSRFWGSGVMLPLAAAEERAYLKIFRDRTAEREAEERRMLLVNELNHRIKNTLATVQSIAFQTLRASDVDRSVRASLESRLIALAKAHDLLTRQNWQGADLRQMLVGALKAFAGESRLRIAGPPLQVSPKAALALGLAVHELATNAAKYGSLASDRGRIDVSWSVDRCGRLCLLWAESGGPEVAPPRARGFGSRLIEGSLARELGGDARIDYRREGLVCTIVAPLGTVGAATG